VRPPIVTFVNKLERKGLRSSIDIDDIENYRILMILYEQSQPQKEVARTRACSRMSRKVLTEDR
jgi:hypothetical protein